MRSYLSPLPLWRRFLKSIIHASAKLYIYFWQSRVFMPMQLKIYQCVYCVVAFLNPKIKGAFSKKGKGKLVIPQGA